MENSVPDMQQLAKQIQRIDDRQQLGELISRYGTAVDDRDFDTIGRLFAPDGDFNGVQGRQAIVDLYRGRTSTFTTSSHNAYSWHFDFDTGALPGGVVNAHAQLCIGKKTVEIALRYLDRYVKGEQGWMFQSRTLKFRYVLPLDELAGGLDETMRVRWPGTQPQAADLPDKLQTYIDSRKIAVAPARPPNT